MDQEGRKGRGRGGEEESVLDRRREQELKGCERERIRRRRGTREKKEGEDRNCEGGLKPRRGREMRWEGGKRE